MHKIALAIAAVFLSSIALAQAVSHPGSAADQGLFDAARAVPEAQKSNNPDLLKQVLADDFLGIGSEGGLHDKADIVDIAREATVKEYRVYNLRVVHIDDGSAIVTYSFIVQMREGDEDWAPRYQTVSDLWIKQGENWKLKFQQFTPLRSID
jgi:hypothetical protein